MRSSIKVGAFLQLGLCLALVAGCGNESTLEFAGQGGLGGQGGQGGAVAPGGGGHGGSGGCQSDNDCADDGLYCNGAPTCIEGACVAAIPIDCGEAPIGCASIHCVEQQQKCTVVPIDNDGDSFGAPGCPDGTIPDTDCNDNQNDVYPGAWDGPACDGKPSRCGDGIDNNCSGADSDGVCSSTGATCTCAPGEVSSCAADPNGNDLPIPGNIGTCALGTMTCGANGKWAACLGAVPPASEVCDGKDNDCDGTADDGNPGSGASCGTGLPGPCSVGVIACSNGALNCKQTIFPGGESCDGVDNNCNGSVDDGLGLGAPCDGTDGDLCVEGVVTCNGSGGTTCSDTSGTTADNCDPGNDANCNGAPNQGCPCINGSTCGQCNKGKYSNCSPGAWGACSDPGPQCPPGFPNCQASQPNDLSIFLSDSNNICHNCSGGPLGSTVATHHYSGPVANPGSVTGTVKMIYLQGGCLNNPNPAMYVDCFNALPGCGEPPEGWTGAYLGRVTLEQNSANQIKQLPTSSSGRTLCCDVNKSQYEWTQCAFPCCNRKVQFDWTATASPTCN